MITLPSQGKKTFVCPSWSMSVCACLFACCIASIPPETRGLAPEDVGHQNKTASHCIWQWSAKQRQSPEKRLQMRPMMLHESSGYTIRLTVDKFKNTMLGGDPPGT